MTTVRAFKFILGFSLALAAGMSGLAQTVIYYDGTDPKANYGLDALNGLGITPTVVGRSGALATALGSKTYDLVVIEEYDLSISETDITALINYINGGGRVIMNYWTINSSSTLQSAFQVSVATSFGNPESFTIWETSSPAVAGLPTVVTALADDNYWGDNGDKFTVLTGGTALAGYASTPTAGLAGIVAGNGNRTIVNGFIASDFSSTDMIKLFQSEIKFLAVPEPSAWTLLGLGAGALWLGWRRRQA